MSDYYSEKLSAERLRRAYDIATPRVRQYLDAEISFVLSKISPTDVVLELGCGYGRVLEIIVGQAAMTAGVDTSFSSLKYAVEMLRENANCHLLQMDASSLGFKDKCFDKVVCIQNGISAFGVNRYKLLSESIRVTRKSGRVLFSSYSDKFWQDRLAWFKLQADEGLLGEIDFKNTRDGVIICKDGFRATTVDEKEFTQLTGSLGYSPIITEIDESSLFCEIVV